MTDRPRVLVTNDDGIGSEGIRQLALAVATADVDLVVAAPAEESSGSSAALSAVQADGRIVVDRRELDGLDADSVFAVKALPGFVALLASAGAFGPKPDVVISGINRGANTGHAVLHSGTVGAALTGRTYGSRAMAVSLAMDLATSRDPSAVLHWATAARLARLSLPLLLDGDTGYVLNLNVPNLPIDQLGGIRSARLAPFGAVQTNVVEVGEGYVQLTVADLDPTDDPDTDAALLAAGYATVTLLNPLCEQEPGGRPGKLAGALESAVQDEG
ncbi:MAG TPA: 5'/3'-nucleotidase SurE [Actinomycetes bacterium]|nr:5'/3'-nucleotidase SurE [Actinomycetes bacterium]